MNLPELPPPWGYAVFQINDSNADGYTPDQMRAYAIAAIAAAQAEQSAIAEDARDNLAALVGQLVRKLRKAAPGDDLSDRALDYLKRSGLQGNPMRSGDEGVEA